MIFSQSMMYTYPYIHTRIKLIEHSQFAFRRYIRYHEQNQKIKQ